MIIGRRKLTSLLGLSFLAATKQARAQARAAAGGIALPCAREPGDIAGLILEGSGAPARTVVVFGQAFRSGDLPRDAVLAARLMDGRPIAVQADVRNRHADGSVRFAVVSLASPSLRRGERVGVVLARAGSVERPMPFDVVAAAAGRSAVVELLHPADNVVWRADLLLRFQDTMLQYAPTTPAVWQIGPLALQARVALAVPSAALGNVASARLVADIGLRADGTLWVDVWLRNDSAMQAGGGQINCGLRLLLDGREVLRRPAVRQFQYTAWGRRAGVARGGAAASIPPRVRHDVGLLADIGAIPRFDLSVGVNEDVLARLATTMAAPAWSVPDDPRNITRYMPMTGGRPDIGFVTGWQAIWLLTGDVRAAEYALGQAEAAGSAPWHFWDAGHGTWLNAQNYPKLWTDARGGTGRPGDTRSTGLTQQMEVFDYASGGTKGMAWELDRAHQPDLSYVPYLLTGERWILDNLQAQSAWNVVGRTLRGPDSLLIVTPDPYNQVRDMAWSMRQIENALWASPDGSPERAYFQAVSNANWSYLVSKIPEWTAAQGEAHGWIPSGIGANGAIAPWQQDFFAGITALAAARGNADALTFLNWQANWLVGRFTHAAEGMNPRDGVAYGMQMFDPLTKAPLTSWAQIGAKTVETGMSNGAAWDQSQGYYGQLGLASLAVVLERTRSASAKRAFDWLQAATPPATRVQDFMANPAFNIVPDGFARVPSRLSRCTPPSPPRR